MLCFGLSLWLRFEIQVLDIRVDHFCPRTQRTGATNRARRPIMPFPERKNGGKLGLYGRGLSQKYSEYGEVLGAAPPTCERCVCILATTAAVAYADFVIISMCAWAGLEERTRFVRSPEGDPVPSDARNAPPKRNAAYTYSDQLWSYCQTAKSSRPAYQERQVDSQTSPSIQRWYVKTAPRPWWPCGGRRPGDLH